MSTPIPTPIDSCLALASGAGDYSLPPEPADAHRDGAPTLTPTPPPLPFRSSGSSYADHAPRIARSTTLDAEGASVTTQTLDAANRSDQNQTLLDGLAATSKQAQALIGREPTLWQAASRKLFPDAVPPVDLHQVYVNTYFQDVTGVFDDNGGQATLTNHLTSSRSVADILSEAIRTGRSPTFADGSNGSESGIFSDPAAVDASAQMQGAAPDQLKARLDQFVADPAGALEDSISEYYATPARPNTGLPFNSPPLDALRLYRGAQFRAEAQLRAGDGSLTPKSKQLIDAVLADPNPDGEQRKLVTTPVVYGVSVTAAGTPVPGVPVPGAFLITDGQPLSEDSAGVLYVPEQGLQEFTSFKALQDHFAGKGRDRLVDTLADGDQVKLGDATGFHLSLNKLDGDVFQYSVQSQLNRQKSDIGHHLQQAKEAGVTELDNLDAIARHASEPLRNSFDGDRVQALRVAAWIDQHRPSWWKNATPAERSMLDGLERNAKTKAEALHQYVQEKVPPLRDYAREKIKEALLTNYPGADIDPDQIQVQSHGIDRTRAQDAAPLSLTQFILNNIKSKWDRVANPSINPHWQASFADREGNTVTLGQDELSKLARDLNVGQGYRDLLATRMLSSEGAALRDAWKDSYAAQMRSDAEDARLSGALNKGDYERVTALLDRSDDVTPASGQDALELSYLKIGGTAGDTFNFAPPDNYRNGASVVGPVLITKKNAGPNDPAILYTPNAPDGQTFRSYTGMNELNRDQRFRQEDWRTYFKEHVSENMQPYLDQQFTRGYSIFSRAKVEGASFDKVQDTLYGAYVGQMDATAQTLAKSNRQMDAESIADLALFAMDVATTAADVIAPGKMAMKSLLRLLSPEKAIASLSKLPNFARVVQKGGHRSVASFASGLPKRAHGAGALVDAAAAHHMNIVSFQGRTYLAPKLPDQPDGHYLLRLVHPDDDGKLISSGIIAKPEIRNGVEVWRRRGIAGGADEPQPGPSRGRAPVKGERERRARTYTDEHGNHPFVRADGSVDLPAYNRHIAEQSARNYMDEHGNHPYVRADGSADITGHRWHMQEQSARNYTDQHGNHPFVRTDGSVDMSTYTKFRKEAAARNYTDAQGNHPYVRADGSVNVAAYRTDTNKRSLERSARNYTDEQGNHPFVRADGSIDMEAFHKFKRESKARNHTDEHGNHPFVRADGSVDMAAYYRFGRESAARNHTDEHGNHPFVRADGSVDATAYRRYLDRRREGGRGNQPAVQREGGADADRGDVTAPDQDWIDDFDLDLLDDPSREQLARDYTDEHGNHRFVLEDGSVNMAAYDQFTGYAQSVDDFDLDLLDD